LPARKNINPGQFGVILRHTRSKSATSWQTLTPRYFRLALRHFGTTPDLRCEILEGTGVSEESLEDDSFRLGLAPQLRQQENLSRLFGEDWAVSAPEMWSHATYGQVSVASQSAASLHDSLLLIVNNANIIGPLFTYRLAVNGEAARFLYDRRVNIGDEHYNKRLEIGYISMRSLFYLYLSRSPSEMKYLFASPEHGYADRVREVLGGEVQFGAGSEGLEFPSVWLRLQSPLRDIATLQAASRRLEAENLALSSVRSIRASVEHLLRARPNGRAKLPDVASLLGLSQRTLVRRLGGEGVTFRQLIEAETERRAEELIGSRAMKMAAVSDHLGFSDPANFARARRRWAKRRTAEPS
jgi:AraC-like DNA-binding protein